MPFDHIWGVGGATVSDLSLSLSVSFSLSLLSLSLVLGFALEPREAVILAMATKFADRVPSKITLRKALQLFDENQNYKMSHARMRFAQASRPLVLLPCDSGHSNSDIPDFMILGVLGG